MKHCIAALLSFGAIPATIAHHSDAGVDMTEVVEFDGTVTSYHWRNPHVYFTVVSTKTNGEEVEWELQMPSTMTMTRMGWNRDTLNPGDELTVFTHAAIDGRPYGILEYATRADGTVLATSFDYDSGTVDPVYDTGTNPSTDSLEGLWIADRAKLTLYPGGFDGFFRAQLVLTEAGAVAQASYDELSAENPESTCVGRPTPAMLVSTTIFPIQVAFDEETETVMIRTELYDEERTAFMDGRGHPDLNERFETGHSIGHWEGETLVVDTANFAEHRSPYQVGVPSGAQKHVVERYRLSEDGTRIIVEFTLEDPEFLAEPLVHERELLFSPDLSISAFNCDPETTRRFVIPE
ncbi:MAG: DUF6152 family protein [Gammaproteobacteria bacterium]